ncbi:MAG: hypothetical protein M3122_03775 [Actinomycetota bacterium]|nr:hypothetical protein [Actinomycetota bacterium]
MPILAEQLFCVEVFWSRVDNPWVMGISRRKSRGYWKDERGFPVPKLLVTTLLVITQLLHKVQKRQVEERTSPFSEEPEGISGSYPDRSRSDHTPG